MIRKIKAKHIKGTTPNGIGENVYVTLGGISQYIQIRGEDKKNPVIIVLHGGPGNTFSHLAYYYQTYLESAYTFVNWDQRGSGRTYYKNVEGAHETPLSTERLLEDLDELVDYIREKLHQDKVIIMGHSWGTLLGSQYVLAHPEKVSAYIGVGQVVVMKAGYLHSARAAIQQARQQGDVKGAERLRVATERFDQITTLENFDFKVFMRMQQYTMQYNRYPGEMSTLKMLKLMMTSPELSFEEVKWFFKTSNPDNLLALQGPLIENCFFEYDLKDIGNVYQVPVHYVTGEYDVPTPIALLETYYENVVAPNKSLTCIPNTGHIPFLDDPQGFSRLLKQLLTQ